MSPNAPPGGQRVRKPVPPTRPAYLPVAGSPLSVDETLYKNIASAKRTLVETIDLPTRSGVAWKAPSKSIIRISTPEGPQVADLNIWNAHNPSERFWASRTRQLHGSHVTTYARLWSVLPYLRPLCTIITDTLSWYGRDDSNARVHDLLGTRCDPYVNVLLSGPEATYDYHCHSNLVRAVAEFGLAEADVHDVINLFQVTGLDEQGRYFMNPCPAERGDFVEVFAEQEVIMALSTCPGGDLSRWGFGRESEKEMEGCCRPLRVEIFRMEEEEEVLGKGGWREPECPAYRGGHGMAK